MAYFIFSEFTWIFMLCWEALNRTSKSNFNYSEWMLVRNFIDVNPKNAKWLKHDGEQWMYKLSPAIYFSHRYSLLFALWEKQYTTDVMYIERTHGINDTYTALGCVDALYSTTCIFCMNAFNPTWIVSPLFWRARQDSPTMIKYLRLRIIDSKSRQLIFAWNR